MTSEKSKLLSLDVGYFILVLLMISNYVEARSVVDLLFFIVMTFYYIRIKIYRWKKYH